MGNIFTLVKNNLLIVIVFIFSLLVAAGLTFMAGKPITIDIPIPLVPSGAPVVSYNGEKGEDALMLLKQHAKVIQGPTGPSLMLNGRVLPLSDFSLYINGRKVTGDPATIETDRSENIVWKEEVSAQ